ncbi:acyltransferase domain-containing protein [Streptomyces roseirectus]|uniref:Acyltransferase domain-containing protein n=1 Tax=Streptomyces roseirectus TaxID=2768066 RepID=A0A7H0IQ32_9ACTN|nr:acyltransferase domain-containing protein [Streptomyces roseirectus]QNP74898.1 acyltransferase domain-containing protein [Streptomyces roseirectus]
MRDRIAFLFPGQGAYLPGLLTGFLDPYPQIGPVLRDVDGVCAEYGHRPVSELLLDTGAPPIDTLLAEHPEALHLCIFTASLACAAVCAAEGVRADVLVGHSFGEWAALTLAGVWTPVEAARLICERDRVCRQAGIEPGGLLAVAVGPDTARHLAGVVDEWSLGVAVSNGPGQSVLAGPEAGLDQAQAVASALGVRAVRVKAAYPYHSPWMRAAGETFREVMERSGARVPTQRVYSPISGSYVSTADGVRDIGAGHMVVPVDFLAALHVLRRDQVTVFVECGAKDIVTRLAAEVLPGVRTLAPMARRGGPQAARTVLAGAAVPAAVPPVPSAATVPAPRRPQGDEVPSAAAVPEESVEAEALPPRAELITALCAHYAERLGYPPDVVTDDVDLEVDLGIDSLRQAEVLASLYARYGLDASGSGDPLRRQTLPDIADHLMALPRLSAPVPVS